MEGKAGNFWKIGFFVLLILFIVGGSIFTWYFLVKSKTPTSTPPPAGGPVSSPTPTVTIKPTVVLTPTPTVDETLLISPETSLLIKQAVYKKTGLDETKAEVTINKNTGTHATGGIKEFEAVGGAYWLAAKTSTGWICVYDGQSQPTCEEIAPYNFPKDMVPECLDANGKVVKR